MLKRFIFSFILLSITASINSFMIPLTVEELTVASDTIISGKVTHIQPYWDPATELIYSKITIEIEELLRGEDVGASCEIRVIGGSIGHIALACPDYPQFTIDEQAVFFLSLDMQSNTYRLPGGNQAKMSLDNLSVGQKRDLLLHINNILNIKKK